MNGYLVPSRSLPLSHSYSPHAFPLLYFATPLPLILSPLFPSLLIPLSTYQLYAPSPACVPCLVLAWRVLYPANHPLTFLPYLSCTLRSSPFIPKPTHLLVVSFPCDFPVISYSCRLELCPLLPCRFHRCPPLACRSASSCVSKMSCVALLRKNM